MTQQANSTLSFTTTATRDLRTFLQAELERRAQNNPRYSLRAYARTLQIDPSALCKILKGKRTITPQMFDHLSTRMGLNEYQKELYKPREGGTSARYQQLAHDLFETIADWHHYALLELIDTADFKPNLEWIAQRLNLSEAVIHEAVDRLQRLGFLDISADGTWSDRSKDITTVGTPSTTEALKKLQKQILGKAIEALDTIPVEERDQSSITMAADSALLLEAKEKVKAFRRELCEFLSSSPKKDSVFHLSVSLYPVTD